MEDNKLNDNCNEDKREISSSVKRDDQDDSDLRGTFTVCYPKSEVEEQSEESQLSKINIRNQFENSDYTVLRRMMSSASLESITSGISSGSSASEERINILRCVASYNDISTKTCFHNSTDEGIGDVNTSRSSHSSAADENATMGQTTTVNKNKLRFEEQFDTEKTKCQSESRKTSSKSTRSVMSPKYSKTSRLHHPDNKFDPTLEKSQTFLHGQSKNFSRANEYLTPARPGLRKLQVSYTQTNTENNQSVIFFDLIKNAHKQNILITEAVSNLERRLLLRRSDPVRKTTFYEQMNLKDPRKALRKKIARTVAEKMKERKEKIKDTTEDMRLGYKPTQKTMKKFTYEDIEKMRDCRYLRIDPKVTLP